MATRIDTSSAWDSSLIREIIDLVQEICRASPKPKTVGTAGSSVELLNATTALRSSILAFTTADLPAAQAGPLAVRVAQLICSSGMCHKLSVLYSQQQQACTLSHVLTIAGSEGGVPGSRSGPVGVLLSSNVMHSIAMVLKHCRDASSRSGDPGAAAAAARSAAKAALFELIRDTLDSGLWAKAAGQLHQAEDEDGA